MTETWRSALWMLWWGLAFLHLVYYTSGWCQQRRQVREADRPARWVEELGTGYPEIDRALGAGPLVPYAGTPEPDERTFCEQYDDPGLMDTWTGRPIEVAEWPCDPGCVLRHAHRME